MKWAQTRLQSSSAFFLMKISCVLVEYAQHGEMLQRRRLFLHLNLWSSERSYNAMRVMTAALPNLQQIALYALKPYNKYSDGEDPDERRARGIAHVPTHDIDIISNFRKLCSFDIFRAPLNGRYPALFNFPLLEKLSIAECSNLRFDLNMLHGLPSLTDLDLLLQIWI